MTKNPALFFYRCLLCGPFSFKAGASVSDLFFKFCYRYDKPDKRSFLTPLRYSKQAISLLFRNVPSNSYAEGSYFVFDEKPSFYESDLSYLKAIGISNPSIIMRHGMVNELSFIEKLAFSLSILPAGLICVIFSMLSRDKAKPAIIITELVEAYLLADFLKKRNANQLLIISAFEKDIFFLAHFLSTKMNIAVSLFPSPNVISLYYKKVTCASFIFSVPYQVFEYEKLKKNWRIGKAEMWPQYGFDSIELRDVTQPAPQYKIGLGSSGMALRKHLRHTVSIDAAFTAEFAMIDAMQSFLSENKNYSILVLLHPLEKSTPANLQFSTDYYRNIFGDNIEFAPFDRPSKSVLSMTDVTVSGFSSSQFERLFGGHKVLFAHMGHLENYYPDPRLKKISASDSAELSAAIKQMSDMDADEYFSHYDLIPYRWDSFKERRDLPL
jgi:hypothetical protein